MKSNSHRFVVVLGYFFFLVFGEMNSKAQQNPQGKSSAALNYDDPLTSSGMFQWEMYTFEVINEYFLATYPEVSYLAFEGVDPINGQVVGSELWLSLKMRELTFDSFHDWLRVEYPDERIPILTTISGFPNFYEWENYIDFDEFSSYDWDKWSFENFTLPWLEEIVFSDQNKQVAKKEAEWKWVNGKRSKRQRAEVEALVDEAKIYNLAKLVRLNTTDSELWLFPVGYEKKYKKGFKGVTDSKKIKKGDKFSVPNTVVVVHGKTGLARVPLGLFYARVITALEKNGFYTEGYSFNEQGKYEDLRATLKVKDNEINNLWGLVMFGHGLGNLLEIYLQSKVVDTTGSLEWDKNGQYVGPDHYDSAEGDKDNWSKHRLGLVIAYMCYSNHASWRHMASYNGNYFGSDGLVIALNGATSFGAWAGWPSLINSVVGRKP